MLKKNKNILSTGNLFLDKIINGFNIGSIVLLIEDTPSSIYETFLKFFIAEGVVNNNKIFFYHSDKNSVNNILNSLPYRSTQVESILNAKKVTDTKSNEMKIAWRYENIKYTNLLEDLVKSCEYVFDLSRELQDQYKSNKILEKFFEVENHNGDEMLRSIIKSLIKDYQDYAGGLSEEDSFQCRVIIPGLFSDMTLSSKDKDYSSLLNNIKIQLQILKNVSRSLNSVTFITIKQDLLTYSKDVYNLAHYYSDYVFNLKSFILDPQKLEDYDALFYVQKLPRILSFKYNMEMETDTYGLIVEKRKVVIEKIDIGVEVDRNTKVKEKDITASQAICGEAKYSKNYEF